MRGKRTARRREVNPSKRPGKGWGKLRLAVRALAFAALTLLAGSAEAAWMRSGKSPGGFWEVSLGTVDGMRGRGCALRHYSEEDRALVSVAVSSGFSLHVSLRSGRGLPRRGSAGTAELTIGRYRSQIRLGALGDLPGWANLGVHGDAAMARAVRDALADAKELHLSLKDGTRLAVPIMAEEAQADALRACLAEARGRSFGL